MFDTLICSGWACVDCLFMLANGDAPTHMEPAELADYLERFNRNQAGTITLGMMAEDHDCKDEFGNLADDCECEQVTFSWSPCSVCGSELGGSRDAVTFWQ